MSRSVICLPGGVAPAAQRYAPLKAAVGDGAELHLKDLEVYRGDAPPPGYSVEVELAGLERFADSLGFERFHLVGYSGGGFISLAFAGARPERLLSLGLFEPAMVPGAMTAEEEVFTAALRAKLSELTGEEFMTTFVREQVKPGTQMPPPRAMPPELQNRPAGIAAMLEAFLAYRFERERLRDCTFPVYLGYGDRTNDIESIKAGVLARLFMDFHVQRHAGIHHFVPPELIYSPAHVNALQEMWLRAEAIAPPARVET
jgi:pimeloyl-ACP methyl ester carboxylesterase